jgi:hypothetical protein
MQLTLLPDLRDEGPFDNRRLLLPLGKLAGLRAICIYPHELPAVAIRDCDLPMAMLSPLVFPEGRFATLFPAFHLRTLPQPGQPGDIFLG